MANTTTGAGDDVNKSNVIHLQRWIAANAAMRALGDRLAPGVTFFSICSGIEAASVAWSPLNWRCVGVSEIEKFPSAVLAHHYPAVRNYGDFTKIDTTRLPRVDILCGGTPCQAFSVAGQRGSLDDARGNLTLAFVDLAHEIQPRNVVWENVPGVLSTKDNAFGCFLAGLVGAGSALPPPKGRRWPNAGMVAGPKGRAAWRVLDAQFFGLAQRRKRVIVVADFGNGADPAAVLFEPESVRRDSPPSRETGQGVAPTISARTKGGGGLGTDFDLDGGLVAKRWSADVSPTLCKESYSPMKCMEGDEAKWSIVEPVGVTGSISHALKAEGADASEDGTGRGTPIVATAINMQGGKGQSSFSEELSPCLGADTQVHGVAITVALRGREGGATAELGGEVATALRASSGGGDKPHVLTSAVRRLTPRECERLQGFPDDYTRIPWRSKQADQCPDGPRYKALGNSWAVPLFTWLGRRIEARLPY